MFWCSAFLDLLANLPVNSLNEWDVTKLGWFKSRSVNEDHIDATGEQIIRQAFRVVVDDCSLNKFKYQVFLKNTDWVDRDYVRFCLVF